MDLNCYFDQLKAAGLKVVAGSKNTLWRSHEGLSMIRQPSCSLHVPSAEEIRSVFRESHAAMLSFTVNPSDIWIPNSLLYICTDPDYSLEKLKSARTVRRGLHEFELRFMDQSEILRLGKQAYCDTHVRTGLSFEHRRSFESAFSHPRHDTTYLGAIKGNRLGAFLMVTEVDDWASVGGYSADEFLPYRPNDALVFYASHHYLVEKKFRVVDYGLSSIQAVSNAEGLHRFKIKMGFNPVPVHRAFVVNPILRPLVNRFSWTVVNRMLKLSPNHTMLKKAEGALKSALQRYD